MNKTEILKYMIEETKNSINYKIVKKQAIRLKHSNASEKTLDQIDQDILDLKNQWKNIDQFEKEIAKEI